jgi:hypothetical protein
LGPKKKFHLEATDEAKAEIPLVLREPPVKQFPPQL